jgi:hypothetical protein
VGSGFTLLSKQTGAGGSSGCVNDEWAINQTAVAWTWASETVTTVALAIEIKAAVAVNTGGWSQPTGNIYRGLQGLE